MRQKVILMMLKIKDTIWLRIRFNNEPGTISEVKHKYIVIDVNTEEKYVELIQLDTVKPNKVYISAKRSNKLIKPSEKDGISKYCYAQLDNIFMIECGDYTFTKGKPITDGLYYDLLDEYRHYQETNQISDNKIVYISLDELINLNQ
jgi:hypothetical protein